MEKKQNFLQKYLWLIALAVGGTGALLIWFFLPHQSEIEEFWWLLVKFAIYFIAAVGISFFPNKLKYGYLLTCLPFFVFLMYIIPRASFFGIFGSLEASIKTYGIEYGGTEVLNAASNGEMYTNLYFLLYPLIIMSVAFAHRMGGGKPGKSIKICVVGIILIFSGLLDLSFNTANGRELAETLDYAHHITVITGRVLTWKEGVIFFLCHIPLIVITLILPLDKWFAKWGLIPEE